MKEVIEEDVFGRPFKSLIPETQEDLDRLDQMQELGEVDAVHSFADDPDRIPFEDESIGGRGE